MELKVKDEEAIVRLRETSVSKRSSSVSNVDAVSENGGSVERETWANDIEFVLSICGYTVGLGSMWRFPYLCYRNGGGAFFIPFVIFLVICGGPMYYMELCLGQFSGKSTITAFDFCPIFRGVGVLMILAAAIYLIFYGVVFAWVLNYLVQSFYPKLGWMSCDNDWNTPNCIDSTHVLLNNGSTNMTLSLNDTSRGSTAATEFWTRKILGKSDGIENFGDMQWHIMAAALVSWVITFACLIKGIKSLGKVVYVTVLAPYVLLLVLLIRGLTLDGGMDGVRMYLFPDFSRLLHPQIWLEAALQVFYSLGPGWGSIITMASFNKFNANALRSSIIVCFADLFTSFFCGLVVFSMVGVLSKTTGTPIEKLPFAGPGLAFVAYPEALGRLPLPNLWAILFFVTLVFIGIDSAFGMLEAVTNSVVDYNYHRLNRYRPYITLAAILSLMLASTLACFSNGVYVFQLIDWYIATFNITIATLFECVCVAWIYGANRFSSDIEMMMGKRPSMFFRICWSIVEPVFLFVLVVTSVIYYSPPTGENGYQYPAGAVVIGNIIGFAPLLTIPAFAVYDLLQRHGSLLTRIHNGLRPSADWKPQDTDRQEEYVNFADQDQKGIIDRLRVDVLGLNSK